MSDSPARWPTRIARVLPPPVTSFFATRANDLRRIEWRSAARRLSQFWLIWSALLLVHEGGHALAARRQGLPVERVTVGMGPVLWRGELGDTRLVLRLVPVAGVTSIGDAPRPNTSVPVAMSGWTLWLSELVTLGGGVLATLVLAVLAASVVMAGERATRRHWTWGRYLVADAVVLTVFNFLPIPPLDGGRAVLGAFAAWRGAPLTGDALLYVHLGGMALAVVPMTLWTRWTTRIDSAAMRWGMPARTR